MTILFCCHIKNSTNLSILFQTGQLHTIVFKLKFKIFFIEKNGKIFSPSSDPLSAKQDANSKLDTKTTKNHLRSETIPYEEVFG